jgi:hypothetical protein
MPPSIHEVATEDTGGTPRQTLRWHARRSRPGRYNGHNWARVNSSPQASPQYSPAPMSHTVLGTTAMATSGTPGQMLRCPLRRSQPRRYGKLHLTRSKSSAQASTSQFILDLEPMRPLIPDAVITAASCNPGQRLRGPLRRCRPQCRGKHYLTRSKSSVRASTSQIILDLARMRPLIPDPATTTTSCTPGQRL